MSSKPDFYVYTAEAATLAPGASETISIPVQADADFILRKMTHFADIALADQTADSRVLPLVTVQITDTGSGRQLMDSPVPISAIFGSGEMPHILSNPRLWRANSNIGITLTNYSSATTYNVGLFFVGEKLYKN